MPVLKWHKIDLTDLDDYARHLIEIRNAESTMKVWTPVYDHWRTWCGLYDFNPHDHSLANEKTIMRFMAYRMKAHNIGSSWARGNAYVLRDWWMKNNVMCEVDSKSMPFLHAMFKGRSIEKPPGILYLIFLYILFVYMRLLNRFRCKTINK